MTIKLDGKQTAATIKADLTARVRRLRDAGVEPGLGRCWSGPIPDRSST